LWNTYTLDFVQSVGGSLVLDGSDYQEFKKEMAGAEYCVTYDPALTISLQRLKDKPLPSSAPPMSVAIAPRDKFFGLGFFAAFAALAAAAFV
jgi:hypothetical protein